MVKRSSSKKKKTSKEKKSDLVLYFKNFFESIKNFFDLYLKNFFGWFLVYSISIILLIALFQNTKVYQNKIGFYIIMGYLLALISRIIHSASKKRELKLSGIIPWGLIYTISYGLVDFFLNKIFSSMSNRPTGYLGIVVFSGVFTLIMVFLRRMKIDKGIGDIRAPSQIFTGIILIAFGILSWRFSKLVFIDWFNWAEGVVWSLLIGLALIIGGVLVLLAWWRNNVLQHRVGLKFGRW